MVRKMEKPIGPMTFCRVYKKGSVEPGSGPRLHVMVQAVLNQVTPSIAAAHLHQVSYVFAVKFDSEQRLCLFSFLR